MFFGINHQSLRYLKPFRLPALQLHALDIPKSSINLVLCSMAAALTELLSTKPFRVLTGTKQLTLAFGGIYIASTTVSAKPVLVWETEKGYPRYYVPTASLHPAVRSQTGFSNGQDGDHKQSATKVELKSVTDESAKNSDSKAVVERLAVGSKTTEWIRFTQGQLKDYIRFEKDDLGAYCQPCSTGVASASASSTHESNTELTTGRRMVRKRCHLPWHQESLQAYRHNPHLRRSRR